MGPLAALTQVSLLVGLDNDGKVVNFHSYSNASVTLKSSPLWNSLPRANLAAFASLGREEYDRIECAFRDFSAGFLLAIEGCINDPQYVYAFWKLKLWCACNQADTVCKHLKNELKKAQAIFLRSGIPEEIPGAYSVYKNIPELFWIHEACAYGTRDYDLTIDQAYMLTQIANFTRAGPYPSHEMVKADVLDTLEEITKVKKLSKESKRSLVGAMNHVYERLHEPDVSRTHVSLSGSGCIELGRAHGGKAAYLVAITKRLTSRMILEPKEIGSLLGLYDCLGQLVVSDETARMAFRVMQNRPVTWGEVLYVPPDRAAKELTAPTEERVPYGLASCIILLCTADIKKIGHYDRPEVPNLLGVPLFEKKHLPVEFQPEVTSLPVKASMSIESAGKSRMVTSAMACVTEIGELINHFMRNWLSKDPFCRVGFEEADKLWEVLKSYGKSIQQNQ
jgi:hypothetical protein